MGNVSKNSRFVIRKDGFTLIELIVVITIIATLFAIVGTLFNPFAQIQKARNATRQHDLNEIKTALDSYFNDTGCYPTGISFGSKLASSNTVYMEKVPQDPDCSNSTPNSCYDYETNGSACPQWNILYAQMHTPIVNGIQPCILSKAQNCLPSGGMLSYNYCAVSGKLDCSYITQNALPTPVAPGGNGGNNNSGGGGNRSTTPTPIPTNFCDNPNLSSCSNGICNVKQAIQCAGCGGNAQCYTDLVCGGVNCKNQP